MWRLRGASAPSPDHLSCSRIPAYAPSLGGVGGCISTPARWVPRATDTLLWTLHLRWTAQNLAHTVPHSSLPHLELSRLECLSSSGHPLPPALSVDPTPMQSSMGFCPFSLSCSHLIEEKGGLSRGCGDPNPCFYSAPAAPTPMLGHPHVTGEETGHPKGKRCA